MSVKKRLNKIGCHGEVRKQKLVFIRKSSAPEFGVMPTIASGFQGGLDNRGGWGENASKREPECELYKPDKRREKES
jgi:hypothetical protein